MANNTTHGFNTVAQSSIFYNEIWTVDVETCFIQSLLREARAGHYVAGQHNNDNSITRAMHAVNTQFNLKLDYNYVRQMSRKLNHRYKTFYEFSQLSGVGFDKVTNIVTCDDEVWFNFCKRERLAIAYKHNGERHFDVLTEIFGTRDDSVGFHELPPIVSISSELNTLSLEDRIHFPRMQVTHDATFWNELAGNNSDNESDGTSPSFM